MPQISPSFRVVNLCETEIDAFRFPFACNRLFIKQVAPEPPTDLSSARDKERSPNIIDLTATAFRVRFLPISRFVSPPLGQDASPSAPSIVACFFFEASPGNRHVRITYKYTNYILISVVVIHYSILILHPSTGGSYNSLRQGIFLYLTHVATHSIFFRFTLPYTRAHPGRRRGVHGGVHGSGLAWVPSRGARAMVTVLMQRARMYANARRASCPSILIKATQDETTSNLYRCRTDRQNRIQGEHKRVPVEHEQDPVLLNTE